MNPKTKTLLFILLAFLLGGVTGGVLVRQYWPERLHRPSTQKDVVKMFSERLHLGATQSAQVDSLLEHRRLRMESYRTAMMSSRDSLRQDIRRLLTPEQNRLFDEFIQETDARDRARTNDHERR